MYLFGKSNPEAPAEVRCKATKALREVGIPYRVVYSGTVTGSAIPYTVSWPIARSLIGIKAWTGLTT